MITISICVGSACHLKGAHGVLHAFATLLEKHQVAGKIDMEGSFCQGRCTEGVVIKINDKLVKNEEYANALIHNGDKVDVIHLISGG